MKVEIHFLIAGITLFVLAWILSISEHAEKLAALRLYGHGKGKIKKKERRLFPRYSTSLRIKYKTDSIEGTSWIKDISKSGAGLFLDRKLEAIAPLVIEINLPYSSRPIFLKGEIVWQKRDNAGVSFSEASLNDINRIFSYIENKSNLQLSNI